MNKNISTHTFFNLGTQRMLYESEHGYVSKEFYISEHVEQIRTLHNLKHVCRLDLGQNSDGCAIKVAQEFEKQISKQKTRYYMRNYPEFVCRKLREKIAAMHNIDPDLILLSAGLDQMLSMITSTFLELHDKVVLNMPSFFLFEDYSKRMGAIPVWINLEEKDNFRWTDNTFREYVSVVEKLRPKLIWIADPNNPTGQSVPEEMIKSIIKVAADNYCFVIYDEAYGEYTDTASGPNSATRFLKSFNNLIVLRTFSKCYGLANLRVAYAMVSDKSIFRALKVHRPYYPITQYSFDFALIALHEHEYLEEVRQNIKARRKLLVDNLSLNPRARFHDTDSSIMMIGHKFHNSAAVMKHLEQHGIIVANVPGNNYLSNNYFRLTLGPLSELEYFLTVFDAIDS